MIGKEKVKLFADNMIVDTENAMESAKQNKTKNQKIKNPQKKTIHEFCKFTRYKNNMQK